MKIMRAILLTAVGISILCVVAVALTRHAASANPPPTSILCDQYITTEFNNGGLVVSCHEDKGAQNMSFTVLPNNVPSPDTVLSYVNNYTMALKQLQVLPEMGTNMKYWNTRILIRFDAAHKITGLRYQTVNYQ
ncbi:MAG: hypothetical protein M3R68_02265 [Acidobacteriota bacterium]|nr:hypothetical protein [Acidobacteriota bacterium]